MNVSSAGPLLQSPTTGAAAPVRGRSNDGDADDGGAAPAAKPAPAAPAPVVNGSGQLTGTRINVQA